MLNGDLAHLLWVEKYRPKTINDCILPASIKDIFAEYVKRKEIPNLLLSGPSGTGKTTVAKALCIEVGCDWLFINGSKESGIDVLRTKITQYSSSLSLYGGRKVVIIDEADYLNPNSTQPAFRAFLEEFSSNVSFIFTCNWKNRLIEPLQGRLAQIDFAIKGSDRKLLAAQFMQSIESILKTENVLYNPKVVATLIMKYFPNYRKTLNEMQKFSQVGEISENVLVNITDIGISDLVVSLKTKNFSDVRNWVVKNNDVDSSTIYRKLYDALSEILKPQSIPGVILVLAKYQYQSGMVMDQEINLMACLVEIMVDGEFK